MPFVAVENFHMPRRVIAELVSYNAIRPHYSQQSQIPGYVLPAFLRNNFAKGWVRPEKKRQSSSPLGGLLSKYVTRHVTDFLDISAQANMRAVSVGADIFIRQHYVVQLEIAFQMNLEMVAQKQGWREDDDDSMYLESRIRPRYDSSDEF